MTLNQFEQNLEKERMKQDELWFEFWHIWDIVKRVNNYGIDNLPITICVRKKKLFYDDVMAIMEGKRVVWHIFDASGKLIVFTLDIDRNVNLFFDGEIMNGKVIDIKKKDDKNSPDTLILTCLAGDVQFKVMI